VSAREEALALLARARGGRGHLKRVAAALDAPGAGALKAAVIQHVLDHPGAPVRDAAALSTWSGKRLVRAALSRADQAQIRENPVARDEAFVCAHCGAAVPPHGRTARDHCPHCLRSLHVDEVPGDRASACLGVLDPVGLDTAGGRWVVLYRCRRCGATHRNQALLDGDTPDDVALLARVAARERV